MVAGVALAASRALGRRRSPPAGARRCWSGSSTPRSTGTGRFRRSRCRADPGRGADRPVRGAARSGRRRPRAGARAGARGRRDAGRGRPGRAPRRGARLLMRVLLTGGAGFVGTNLALALARAARDGSWSRWTTYAGAGRSSTCRACARRASSSSTATSASRPTCSRSSRSTRSSSARCRATRRRAGWSAASSSRLERIEPRELGEGTPGQRGLGAFADIPHGEPGGIVVRFAIEDALDESPRPGVLAACEQHVRAHEVSSGYRG